MSEEKTQWWQKYVPEHMYGDHILNLPFEEVKEEVRVHPAYKTVILAHKDCTEKDLIDLAKTDAELSWETVDRSKEGWGYCPIVGKFTMWGKIFMDPHASDELKQAIVAHSEAHRSDNHSVDIEMRIHDRKNGYIEERDIFNYYLKREDCPKEFFLPAVQDSMGSYYHKYTRQTDYNVDAEYLREVVAHPNMTEEAFEEALDIVAERMCQPADGVDPNNPPYHYQGEDDTCDLTRKDKERIMQTMLKNKACTPEIALEIFEVAEISRLSEEISKFNKEENLFPGIERKLKLKQVRDKVHNTPDYLTVKQAGDTELNKTAMVEKFLEGDPLAKKKAGNTHFNKIAMKLRKQLHQDL